MGYAQLERFADELVAGSAHHGISLADRFEKACTVQWLVADAGQLGVGATEHDRCDTARAQRFEDMPPVVVAKVAHHAAARRGAAARRTERVPSHDGGADVRRQGTETDGNL